MNRFVIECVNDSNLVWSNTDGWTDGCDFDVFTLDETETLTLPIEGAWVRLNEWFKKGDELQGRYLELKRKADTFTNDNDFKNWADFSEYSELLDIFERD
jgi:hypothetical protein